MAVRPPSTEQCDFVVKKRAGGGWYRHGFFELFRSQLRRNFRAEKRAPFCGVATNKLETLCRMPQKKLSALPESHRVLKRLLGCKWTYSVFPLLRDGINRPGVLEKSIEGMTAKVLGDCLRKNVSMGILEKKIYPEIPPRVEYHFTDFGKRFLDIFAILENFQEDICATMNRPVVKKPRKNLIG